MNRRRLKAKLLSRVDTSKGLSSCWVSYHCKNKDGYTRFGLDGVWWDAHRASYIVFKGEIPEGMEIGHLCDKPQCCNPGHVDAMTHKQNVRMAADRGHYNGVKNGACRHTEEQVIEVKRLGQVKKIPYQVIAEKLNMNESTVRDIVKDRYWRHIKLPPTNRMNKPERSPNKTGARKFGDRGLDWFLI
jgi:hypothetical protein